MKTNHEEKTKRKGRKKEGTERRPQENKREGKVRDSLACTFHKIHGTGRDKGKTPGSKEVGIVSCRTRAMQWATPTPKK